MNALTIFAVGMIFGGMVELGFAFAFDIFTGKPFRLNHRFTLTKRISFFSLPIWGLLFLIFSKSTAYALVFFYAAVLGTVLEALMGKFVLHIFGTRVWTYKRGKIGDFTSIYSIPYWGAAGLIFAIIGKLLKL